MRIKVIKSPTILFETVAMICRYYRKESYSATAERLSGAFSNVLSPAQISELKSNGEIAERLMNSICSDIDLENEDFKFFFKPFDTGDALERNCVARVLVFSMIKLEPSGFEDSIAQIKAGWSQIKSEGIEILHFHMHGLNFINANGRNLPSLFEQIYAMDYPRQAKMDSFLALEQHELYLDRLAKLIYPYAARLESELYLLEHIYDSAANYWELNFSVMTNEDVVALMRIKESAIFSKLSKAYISLFFFNEIGNSFDDTLSTAPEDITTLYIGMAIYPEYTAALAERRTDMLVDALKALADPIRIELLSRLARQPDYCLKLANDMDLNQGNVSRHLSLLYDNHFLSKQKRDGRLYFETDLEALTRILSNLLACIKP